MPEDLDSEELKKFDGKDGRPSYICLEGRIVDVSQSPLWTGGLHMGRHAAGKDLTGDIEAAPHGAEVLDRYPQVARLIAKHPIKDHLPRYVSALLNRHPFFRRHLHPLTVHFPIVFTLSATFFHMLSVTTGSRSFDQTAFYCLVGALLFMPPAIITGFATWWINYMALPMRPVSIKMALSFVLMPLLLILVLWHAMSAPGTGYLSVSGPLYLLTTFVISPIVVIISYYGGMLTFPLEKDQSHT